MLIPKSHTWQRFALAFPDAVSQGGLLLAGIIAGVATNKISDKEPVIAEVTSLYLAAVILSIPSFMAWHARVISPLTSAHVTTVRLILDALVAAYKFNNLGAGRVRGAVRLVDGRILFSYAYDNGVTDRDQNADIDMDAGDDLVAARAVEAGVTCSSDVTPGKYNNETIPKDIQSVLAAPLFGMESAPNFQRPSAVIGVLTLDSDKNKTCSGLDHEKPESKELIESMAEAIATVVRPHYVMAKAIRSKPLAK